MQIDACRVAGVNENIANLLLAAKFGVRCARTRAATPGQAGRPEHVHRQHRVHRLLAGRVGDHQVRAGACRVTVRARHPRVDAGPRAGQVRGPGRDPRQRARRDRQSGEVRAGLQPQDGVSRLVLGRREVQHGEPGIEVCRPGAVGDHEVRPVHGPQDGGQHGRLAGAQAERVQRGLRSRLIRFGPDEQVPVEERRLGMAATDDAGLPGRQVGQHHLDLAARPVALRPGGVVSADRRGMPGARPRGAVAAAQRMAEPAQPPGSRVPGVDREVIQALQRVSLLPDQPAPARGPVGLVDGRVGEGPDAPQVPGGDVHRRDAGEPGRPGGHVRRPAVRRRTERDDLALQRARHRPPQGRPQAGVRRRGAEPLPAHPARAGLRSRPAG